MAELLINLTIDQILLISLVGLMVIGGISAHGLNKLYNRRT